MPEFKDRKEYEYFRDLSKELEAARQAWSQFDKMFDAAQTADGCRVEPDGTCGHGYRSPLLLLGLI